MSVCFQMKWPDAVIRFAEDGSKGLKALESEIFDIVILDINLPDISGFDVLHQARSFSDVPIIIVTVRYSEDDKSRGLELGADDYIVKPFSPRHLVSRISAVLGQDRSNLNAK
jgi:DNA-binding response OmpR family regulator